MKRRRTDLGSRRFWIRRGKVSRWMQLCDQSSATKSAPMYALSSMTCRYVFCHRSGLSHPNRFLVVVSWHNARRKLSRRMRRGEPPPLCSWASKRRRGATPGRRQQNDYVYGRAPGGAAHTISDLVGSIGPPALDSTPGKAPHRSKSDEQALPRCWLWRRCATRRLRLRIHRYPDPLHLPG